LEVIAPQELRVDVIARLTSALASYPEARRSP
jgi:hypothetical protein